LRSQPLAYKEPIFYNVRSPKRTSPRVISNSFIDYYTDPYSLFSFAHLATSSGPYTQLAVAREVAKQVYVGEKLAPPSWAQASYTCTFRLRLSKKERKR
jgi:ABC-type antimicrobial peptide transport system permease subunit